jgi:hypothetical protein
MNVLDGWTGLPEQYKRTQDGIELAVQEPLLQTKFSSPFRIPKIKKSKFI